MGYRIVDKGPYSHPCDGHRCDWCATCYRQQCCGKDAHNTYEDTAMAKKKGRKGC